MSIGKRIASHSKLIAANPAVVKRKKGLRNTSPVMIYLDDNLNEKWEEFARKNRTSKSQIAREAIQSRINLKIDSFTSGYNTALEEMVVKLNEVEAFKMTFPSGKSFAVYAEEAIAELHRTEQDE